MRRDGNKLIIDMKNRVREGEKITFTTKKPRREEHGIGTKIIGSLVEKYHGTLEVAPDEDAGMFEERIVLCSNTGDENGSF